MRRVVLTGCSGFIGANVLSHFIASTDWHVVGIDSFLNRGTFSRLSQVRLPRDRFTLLKHDLSVPIDTVLERSILSAGGDSVDPGVFCVFNLASDSCVDRSIADPAGYWANNCGIAVTMLEFARRVSPEVFLHLSTDEVYGDCQDSPAHVEWSPIVPSNPYAASKAAQEALAISYWRTYGTPLILANTMNCLGRWQDPEKFLPRIIRAVAAGDEIGIHAEMKPGGERQIGRRCYLHVENLADALVFLAERRLAVFAAGDRLPTRFNVVGDVELDNLELAKLVADIVGKPLRYRFEPANTIRSGYDNRYALDGSKLSSVGWRPPVSFHSGLESAVRWTLESQNWL